MVNLLELFGKRIRGLRRAKELTQEQLAEIAGISLQNMGEIERGKGNPTLVTVEKLSAALDEDLSSIFDFGSSVLTKEKAVQELEGLLSGATREQAQAILVVAQIILQEK
ncbi:MAG: XRE family transcriptional regulator [Negativicutes bacterium]|nr:XRE family transcriptional regulator [Negativicutes bacterium]